MFDRKTLIFLMLLLSIISLSTVSAADNITEDAVGLEEVDDDPISVEETQVIEKTENDDVLKEGNNSFGNLANLIDSAESGSTIVLDRDYINDDDYDIDGIEIKKDITIDGQGHTIDANYSSRIFQVSDDAKVVFKNITFKNGEIMETGGWHDADQPKRGGAIDGFSTAINCYFYHNAALGLEAQ